MTKQYESFVNIYMNNNRNNRVGETGRLLMRILKQPFPSTPFFMKKSTVLVATNN